MAINRCAGTDRISQATVKAMLQTASVVGFQVGDDVQYQTSQGMVYTYRVVKVDSTTVDLNTGTTIITVPMASITKKKPTFFDKLSDDQWTIDSFDSKSRIVCITVDNGSTLTHLSVLLPSLTSG